MVKLSADEKAWQTESDARTLAEAEAIKADSSRKKAAATAAKAMAEKEAVEARAMKKIARLGKTKKRTSTSKKKKK